MKITKHDIDIGTIIVFIIASLFLNAFSQVFIWGLPDSICTSSSLALALAIEKLIDSEK